MGKIIKNLISYHIVDKGNGVNRWVVHKPYERFYIENKIYNLKCLVILDQGENWVEVISEEDLKQSAK